jgi:hypothetical protein
MWDGYLQQFQGASLADGSKHLKLKKNPTHAPYLLNVHCSNKGSVLCLPLCGSLDIFESWVEAAMARQILESEWALRREAAPTSCLRLSQAESNKEEQHSRKT